MGIWYAGLGAETPSSCNDHDVSMDLISFEDTLWPLRLIPGLQTYWGNPSIDDGYGGSFPTTYVTGASFGLSYSGDDGCKANPPWNWPTAAGGAWFLTPATEPYVVNTYTDPSSAEMPPCP
jgi:hypothetical protein